MDDPHGQADPRLFVEQHQGPDQHTTENKAQDLEKLIIKAIEEATDKSQKSAAKQLRELTGGKPIIIKLGAGDVETDVKLAIFQALQTVSVIHMVLKLFNRASVICTNGSRRIYYLPPIF
jgi:hypothetical protein